VKPGVVAVDGTKLSASAKLAQLFTSVPRLCAGTRRIGGAGTSSSSSARDQIANERQVLTDIIYDDRDDALIVGLEAPDADVWRVEHVIEHPQRVLVATGEPPPLEVTFDVEDGEQHQWLIHLERTAEGVSERRGETAAAGAPGIPVGKRPTARSGLCNAWGTPWPHRARMTTSSFSRPELPEHWRPRSGQASG
jgi:hypothetical protein